MSRPKSSGLLVPVINKTDLTYLAMRAGPIGSDQLRARLGCIDQANRLARIGHATAVQDGVNTIYRLTSAGRAACPSRRQLEREVVPAYGNEVKA
jgi:hypothetical protein